MKHIWELIIAEIKSLISLSVEWHRIFERGSKVITPEGNTGVVMSQEGDTVKVRVLMCGPGGVYQEVGFMETELKLVSEKTPHVSGDPANAEIVLSHTR